MPDPVHVIVHKAASAGGEETPGLLIEARVEFPEGRGSDEAGRIHANNAHWLGKALIATLPGGTIDRLLLYLLEHQASLYRVRHRPLEPKAPPAVSEGA